MVGPGTLCAAHGLFHPGRTQRVAALLRLFKADRVGAVNDYSADTSMLSPLAADHRSSTVSYLWGLGTPLGRRERRAY